MAVANKKNTADIAKKPPTNPNKTNEANNRKIMAFIEQSVDPDRLASLVRNARAQGATVVADAAFRKLVSIVPTAEPGTVERDFWQAVQATEFTLTEERGKATRMSRTRLKAGKQGVLPTLAEWALKGHDSNGLKILVERQMPEFTGEAAALRHSDKFEADVVEAARARLAAAGVDVAALR